MGSNDAPPPHIPSHVKPVCNALLQIGGSLWTLCYILLTRSSIRTKSYGMPLFALAFNFAWELVYALYVAEERLEQICFGIWLLIDCGMVYGVVKYGHKEWDHAPVVKRNLGKIWGCMLVGCVLAHWTFARWWIENDVGAKQGKIYGGMEYRADTTELGFWTAVLAQMNLSIASLCQLVIRQHSGGVSWGVWTTRFLGSVFGLYANYAWAWYFWREAHEYFMSPFAIFLWATSLLFDLIYPFVLWQIRKTERVLSDGRKASGGNVHPKNGKAA